MPVSVVTAYSIALDDSPKWHPDVELVKHAGGRVYIKLKANESKFIRIVCHDFIELPKHMRFSLCHSAQWRKLHEARNHAAFGAPKLVAGGLFGNTGKPAPKTKSWRPKRVTVSQMQALRDAAEPLEFELPGDDDNPSLVIASLRPAHPEDDVWVALDPDTLMHITRFLRKCLTLDELVHRRAYNTEAEPGVWRNGSAGVVRRVRDARGDDGCEEDVPEYKSLKTDSIGQPVLLDASTDV